MKVEFNLSVGHQIQEGVVIIIHGENIHESLLRMFMTEKIDII